MFKILARSVAVLVLTAAVAIGIGPVTGTTPVASASAEQMGTESEMRALANSIDPGHTMTWVWTKLSPGIGGYAEPWNRLIHIGSGYPVHYLRPIMLHEWSHVLEYRAFGSTVAGWFNAEKALDSLLGKSVDQAGYEGLEKGADCIAKALGADYLGYGCPPALQTFGARIAHGLTLTKPLGSADSYRTAGSTVTVAGWSFDPTNPTRANVIQVTDNGKSIGKRTATTVRRTDVDAYYGLTGTHGFKVVIQLTPGRHRICVTASRFGSGKADAALSGCRTVVIARSHK